MCSGKAPSAGKGCSLAKEGNAAWAHLGSSLRAGREGLICGVAPLAKGATLPCEARLAAKPFPAR